MFLGCNSFADYEIGRVLKVIDEKMPDALVIYTSDHGDMLGSHHLNQKNAAIYREVANIPLIIRGGEKGKIVVQHPASHIDLAPTIMDYFGLKIPKCLCRQEHASADLRHQQRRSTMSSSQSLRDMRSTTMASADSR